jgi:hypothetical protein
LGASKLKSRAPPNETILYLSSWIRHPVGSREVVPLIANKQSRLFIFFFIFFIFYSFFVFHSIAARRWECAITFVALKRAGEICMFIAKFNFAATEPAIQQPRHSTRGL